MQEVDGATPDCEIEGKSCLIPPLDAAGQRIMEIYTTLRALSGLVDSDTVLDLYDIDKTDIGLLVVVENEYKKAQKPADRD